MVRVCTRARYSPKIPRANSCAPEKIEMIEARKEKPGTTPPYIRNRIVTSAKIATPNMVNINPTILAICSGKVLNPVSMFIACVISFLVV